MRVLVTGFPDGKKIRGIKAIRAATRMGLAEAKDVADRVVDGDHVEIDVPPEREFALAGSVDYRRLMHRLSNAAMVDLLERIPQDMTVGDLTRVFRAIRDAEDS